MLTTLVVYSSINCSRDVDLIVSGATSRRHLFIIVTVQIISQTCPLQILVALYSHSKWVSIPHVHSSTFSTVARRAHVNSRGFHINAVINGIFYSPSIDEGHSFFEDTRTFKTIKTSGRVTCANLKLEMGLKCERMKCIELKCITLIAKFRITIVASVLWIYLNEHCFEPAFRPLYFNRA